MSYVLEDDYEAIVKSIEQIYTEDGQPLDMSKIELVSNRGHEFIVFRYLNFVIKIYRSGYTLSHLSLDELNFLKGIATQRILLPQGTLWNANGELRGYHMPLILGKRNMDNDNLGDVFQELEILRKDLEWISHHGILLRDINLSNTIYNGGIYLVDPGNYLVDGLEKVMMQIKIDDPKLLEEIIKIVKSGCHDKMKDLIDSLPPEEKLKYIRAWNYGKIDSLIYMLIFSKNNEIDPYLYRQIIQFIIKEQDKHGFIYNLDVLRMFMNEKLSVGEAVDDFIKKHIPDNPEERKLFFSLY